MDTLFESARMMASFKDRTIEPGCFLSESIGVNNLTFAIERSESFLSKDASTSFVFIVFVEFPESLFFEDAVSDIDDEIPELIFFEKGSKNFVFGIFAALSERAVDINDFDFIKPLIGEGKTSTLSLNVSSEILEKSSALAESAFIAKIKNNAVSFIKRNILQRPKNELDIHRL